MPQAHSRTRGRCRGGPRGTLEASFRAGTEQSEWKQNRHESATRESNPPFPEKASRFRRRGAQARAWLASAYAFQAASAQNGAMRTKQGTNRARIAGSTIRVARGATRKRLAAPLRIMVAMASTRPRRPAPDPGSHAQNRDKGGANRESGDSLGRGRRRQAPRAARADHGCRWVNARPPARSRSGTSRSKRGQMWRESPTRRFARALPQRPRLLAAPGAQRRDARGEERADE